MLSKSKLVIAAAMVLGVVSAAQAGAENQSDPSGGYRYGPYGQRMGGNAINPAVHRSTRHSRGAYAFVPSSRARHWEFR